MSSNENQKLSHNHDLCLDLTITKELTIVKENYNFYWTLSVFLRKCDYWYYDKNVSIIPDAEYDILKANVRHFLEQTQDYCNHEIYGIKLQDIKKNIDNVGYKPSHHQSKITLSTKRHMRPVLSLNSTTEWKRILDFYDKANKFRNTIQCPMSIELKIDGVSMVLIYEYGVLQYGITRGDGQTGEDVTNNILMLPNVPKTINPWRTWPMIEVRGEIFVEKKDFQSYITNNNTAISEEIPATSITTSSSQLNLFNISDNKNNNNLNDESLISETNHIQLHSKKNISSSMAKNIKYSNPRNFAAGALRNLDAQQIKDKKLKFLAYNLYGISGLNTQNKNLLHLKECGFLTDAEAILCNYPNELLVFYNKIRHQRNSLPFEIDGIVCKINDLNWAEEMGNTSQFPRGAIAFKFDNQQTLAEIINIENNVGRTGIVTPVAIFKEQICIGGVMINSATLHNYGYVVANKIGIGDRAMIARAGDVIPYIVKIYNKNFVGPINIYADIPSDGNFLIEKETELSLSPNNFAPSPILLTDTLKDMDMIKIPTHCPNCNNSLQWINNIFLKCNNQNCTGRILSQIEHAASKEALNIKGLGPKIIKILNQHSLLSNIADIFYLHNFRDKIIAIKGLGEKFANNLFQNIKHSAKTTWTRLIFALGIEQFGLATIDIMLKTLKTLDNLIPYIICIKNDHNELVIDIDQQHKLYQAITNTEDCPISEHLTQISSYLSSQKNIMYNYLLGIDGIGPIAANAFVNYFFNKANIDHLKKILTNVKIITRDTIDNANINVHKNKLFGKNIVFTGALSISRHKAKIIAQNCGAIVLSSITNHVDYIVSNNAAMSSLNKKIQIAHERNIPIINEQEFLDCMKEAAR